MGKVHVHHNINTCAVNPYGEEEPRDSFLAKIAPNGRVPTVVRATNLHGYTATARIHGLFFCCCLQRRVRCLPLPRARLPRGFRRLAGPSGSPHLRRRSRPEPSAGRICPSPFSIDDGTSRIRKKKGIHKTVRPQP